MLIVFCPALCSASLMFSPIFLHFESVWRLASIDLKLLPRSTMIVKVSFLKVKTGVLSFSTIMLIVFCPALCSDSIAVITHLPSFRMCLTPSIHRLETVTEVNNENKRKFLEGYNLGIIVFDHYANRLLSCSLFCFITVFTHLSCVECVWRLVPIYLKLLSR